MRSNTAVMGSFVEKVSFRLDSFPQQTIRKIAVSNNIAKQDLGNHLSTVSLAIGWRQEVGSVTLVQWLPAVFRNADILREKNYGMEILLISSLEGILLIASKSWRQRLRTISLHDCKRFKEIQG